MLFAVKRVLLDRETDVVGGQLGLVDLDEAGRADRVAIDVELGASGHHRSLAYAGGRYSRPR